MCTELSPALLAHLQGKYQQCQSSMGKNVSVSCLAKVDEGMHLQLLLQNYKDEMLISEVFPDIKDNIYARENFPLYGNTGSITEHVML